MGNFGPKPRPMRMRPKRKLPMPPKWMETPAGLALWLASLFGFAEFRFTATRETLYWSLHVLVTLVLAAVLAHFALPGDSSLSMAFRRIALVAFALAFGFFGSGAVWGLIAVLQEQK